MFAGRGAPHVTTALVGDGEGTFITTPIHKESIKSRSREDLAHEAALVLQQADSIDCYAQDHPNRKYASLPDRSRKHKHKRSTSGSRRGEDTAAGNHGDKLHAGGSPKPKKKALLGRSASDAGGFKNTITKLFSPKLEQRKQPPPLPATPPRKPLLKRSQSDAATLHLRQPPRKRLGGSESDDGGGGSSHQLRAKKPLSPIIEASPQVTSEHPFHFGTGKPRERVIDVEVEQQQRRGDAPAVKTIPIQLETSRSSAGVDEVDHSMLHTSRYDQRGEESTIHKMIHRLSNDRSPPPQMTRTMVTPGPGFGHNNNRPFSYTRPNDTGVSPVSPTPPQTDVIYAQVQMDKKKAAQRSHSDSDEGLGLERKDSSRENSPADKEYNRSSSSGYYANDLQRNNEINSLKSRYDATSTTHFGDTKPPTEKYTSTIFVDTSSRGRADGMDSKRRDNSEFITSRLINERPAMSKTSELSARRDLLESRIKSRLLADEMFAAKNGIGKKTEHEIIDKPIVPSPVIPGSVASPKRYTDTYISETRTTSKGDKYIFEKEIHEDNGKVYGFEKKMNKVQGDASYLDVQPKEGFTIETHTDKYGDKYIVETRTHGGYGDRIPVENGSPDLPTPPLITRKFGEHSFIKNEENFDGRHRVKSSRDLVYQPKVKKNFEALRGKSKSTQRLDELSDNTRLKSLRSEYMTRSHENLTSADYVNARDLGRGRPASNLGYKEHRSSPFIKRHHLSDLREGPNDEYDTDISQATNSQLESSKFYKETRMTQRYLSNKRGLHEDSYDSSPPRLRSPHIHSTTNGYNSSRYDSDTTARDSILCESRNNIRKERIIEEDPKKAALRRSRNRLDYLDDSDATRDSSSRSKSSKTTRLIQESFDADHPPQRPPRLHHESKLRHQRHHETRGYSERRHHHHQRQETRLSDHDRKDRLADSGIENDYRRDSAEADSGGGRREHLESEDEGFVTMQFIKQERRHTDRNMNLGHGGDKRRHDKYVMYYENTQPLTSKPPSGADVKKYEKKAAKKSGTMSKVKELFRKKEKKIKEEKNKKNMRASSSGALTDDEVTMRYREYRGDQLRSARSARDLESEINEVSFFNFYTFDYTFIFNYLRTNSRESNYFGVYMKMVFYTVFYRLHQE